MLAPNAYTAKTKSEQANIDRRAKMIELLQGQANAPIERFGYGGIEAYTPPAAYLAKILSGAMAGYQSGKAGREQAALDKDKEQAQNQDMGTMIEMLQKGGTVPTDVSSVYDTSYIKDPAKRAEQDAYLSAPTTSMSQSQPPSYTGGALNMTMPTAQPSAPVTEIQERRYSMRTPEGLSELLRQTASDKQAMAKLLLDQRNREDDAQKAAMLEAGRNARATETAGARIKAAELALQNKPLTESQVNNQIYGSRMQESEGVLGAQTAPDITQQGLSKIPVFGNTLVSPETQVFKQAENNFINALLRRESGAAIASSEYDNARRQYIPLIGDSPEVLKTKQDNRSMVSSRLMAAGGKELMPNEPENNTVTAETLPYDDPVLSDLKEGFVSNFKSGQSWTLENGKAKRIK
jgi:hypothetical protein